jgi:hypothetical protein
MARCYFFPNIQSSESLVCGTGADPGPAAVSARHPAGRDPGAFERR